MQFLLNHFYDPIPKHVWRRPRWQRALAIVPPPLVFRGFKRKRERCPRQKSVAACLGVDNLSPKQGFEEMSAAELKRLLKQR
ncbi:hypothetical protein OAM67_00365 [bacterium]|nr:hypothetical protein [bacterium]